MLVCEARAPAVAILLHGAERLSAAYAGLDVADAIAILMLGFFFSLSVLRVR